jgi:hypothetical protein
MPYLEEDRIICFSVDMVVCYGKPSNQELYFAAAFFQPTSRSAANVSTMAPLRECVKAVGLVATLTVCSFTARTPITQCQTQTRRADVADARGRLRMGRNRH